ncbi:MAG: DUF1801 domain-containing protein [Thermoplasmata archaeon]
MPGPSPSVLIERYIASIKDWRGERMAQIRRLIHEADPEIVEEWKWMGTPTWSHDGIVAVVMPLKEKVKLTFSRGAHLPDPQKVFNNGLGGKEWRAVDLLESDRINEGALKRLISAAVEFNRSETASAATLAPRKSSSRPRKSPRPPRSST